MRRRAILTPTALLAACVVVLFAAPAAGAKLRLLAPPDGVVVAGGPVVLIGRASGNAVEITLNGRKVPGIKRAGDAFTGPLALAAGKNRLVLVSGGDRIEATLVLDPKAGRRVYGYHDPVDSGECKACHPQGVGRTSPVTEARFCNACHEPKNGARVLHGPIGAGQCTICHDPHGSANDALLVAETAALCRSCHDQSRTIAHMERSSSRGCPECHDPHGSEKKYLLY